MQAIVNMKTGECLGRAEDYSLQVPGCEPPIVPVGFEIVTLDGADPDWGWSYDLATNSLVPDAEVRAAIQMTTVDAKVDGLKAQLADVQAQLDAVAAQADASTVDAIQADIDAAKTDADDVKAAAADVLDAVEADPAAKVT